MYVRMCIYAYLSMYASVHKQLTSYMKIVVLLVYPQVLTTFRYILGRKDSYYMVVAKVVGMNKSEG